MGFGVSIQVDQIRIRDAGFTGSVRSSDRSCQSVWAIFGLNFESNQALTRLMCGFMKYMEYITAGFTFRGLIHN